MRRIGLVLLAGALGALAIPVRPARADVNYFAYTYGWWTSQKGTKELEFYHTQPTSGRHFDHQIELEYGVTDRYMIAPYVLFDYSGGFGDVPDGGEEEEEEEGGTGTVFDPIRNGRAYRYRGIKLEQRYRFGDYAVRRVLPAAYLELAKVRGEKAEAEGKLILQFDPDARTSVAFNLIAERRLQRGAEWEKAYSGGAVRMIDANARSWAGFESFGNWTEKQHWIGPVVGGYVAPDSRLVATYGKALSRGGDQFRLLYTRPL